MIILLPYRKLLEILPGVETPLDLRLVAVAISVHDLASTFKDQPRNLRA